MNIIDTHAHIYYTENNNCIDEIINNAIKVGIEKIICVGVDLKTSEECIKLSEEYPIIYAACGYHPHEASKTPNRYLYELEQLYSHPKVVAVGEVGLDYHYNFTNPKIQQRIFLEQLEMANSINTPVIIHCRDSDEDILNGIKNTNSHSGVIHCFASNFNFAKEILKTGFLLSFTGMITFVKELMEVVKEIPIEHIMLETDSPYLAPIPKRGKTNQPANIVYTLEKLAELKQTSPEIIANITTQNAYKLFSKLSKKIK